MATPVYHGAAEWFVGANAGKPILEAMHQARRRIWVLSPYVDPTMVGLLAAKAQEGLDVYLVSSRDDNLYLIGPAGSRRPLFTQYRERREVDPEKARLGRWLQRSRLGLGALFLATLGALVRESGPVVEALLYGVETGDWTRALGAGLGTWGVAVALEVAGLMGFTAVLGSLRTARVRIEAPFRLDLFRNPYQNKGDKNATPFVHSKIYLVDDQAFTGSLNFTRAGFVTNVETRLRFEGADSVAFAEGVFEEMKSCIDDTEGG